MSTISAKEVTLRGRIGDLSDFKIFRSGKPQFILYKKSEDKLIFVYAKWKGQLVNKNAGIRKKESELRKLFTSHGLNVETVYL